MAAITKLSQKTGIKYRVTINMPGIRPFSRNFKTKKTAVAWTKKTEGNLELARVEGNKAARNLTLATLINELVNSRIINPATVIALTWWKDNYGHELCLLFDKSAVREALKCLADKPAFRGERKRTNATINRYKASLSSAFEYGREHYDLPGNPCREIKARPVPSGRIRWLDNDEKKTLLKACKASDWDKLYLLVTMAITTGARQGELLRLRWQDLDFTARRAYVYQTKNGEPRVLPLVDSVIEELKKQRDALIEARQEELNPGVEVFIEPATLIFESSRAPGKAFEFRKHWSKAIKKAEISNFRFHDLRHTCASYLAQNGATLLQIADVLGHKQLEVTKRYSHLCVDHKQSLVDRVLGEVL
jgi:integrase